MVYAVRVLIVDEQAELQPSFRATLEHAPSLRTIGEDDLGRTDGESAVALVTIREDQVEAGRGRIEALRAAKPSLRVLAIFHALGTGDIRRLIEAGADAFVGHGVSAHEVCRIILALADGGGRLLGRGSVENTAIDGHDSLGLTRREAEVLRFLSAGFSNKEVARRLSLSVRTVETHRLNLRRKTQTGRLKDLVSLARQLGLDPVVETETKRVCRH